MRKAPYFSLKHCALVASAEELIRSICLTCNSSTRQGSWHPDCIYPGHGKGRNSSRQRHVQPGAALRGSGGDRRYAPHTRLLSTLAICVSTGRTALRRKARIHTRREL